MTAFTLNTLSTTNRTLAFGERGLVTTNGTLATDSGTAITTTGSVVVSVHGTVDAASGAAIRHSGGDVLDLNVGLAGILHSAGAGTVGIATVYAVNSDHLLVQNAGVIQSDGFAAIYADQATSTNIEISNFGTLQGDTGIRVSGNEPDATILNTGLILGIGEGIQFTSTTTAAVSRFVNRGSVVAGEFAYVGAMGTDIVTNAGSMIGHVSLEDGADTYLGIGGELLGHLDAGDGNDTINLRDSLVSDYVAGNDDDDTYIVSSSVHDLIEAPDEGTDTVRSTVKFTLGENFENLTLLGGEDLRGRGNDEANAITGNAGDNVLVGYDGNDTLTGRAGDDTLRGGEGKDRLLGGGQDDRLIGHAGNDSLLGGNGDDGLTGSDGNDSLNGQIGNDTLTGSDGKDVLVGGDGNDSLLGGRGVDTLTGGDGDDTLNGNSGNDIFVFADSASGFGNDLLIGFGANNNAEKIDLSGVTAITNFNDLSNNHMSQSGSDVVINALAGNTITLLNVDIGDLNAVDFIF